MTKIKKLLKQIKQFNPSFKWNKKEYNSYKKKSKNLGLKKPKQEEILQNIFEGIYVSYIGKQLDNISVNENNSCDLEIKS